MKSSMTTRRENRSNFVSAPIKTPDVRGQAVQWGLAGRVVSRVTLLGLVVLSTPVGAAAQPADMEQGKRLYERQCGS